MIFKEIFFSYKVLLSIALVILISIILTFFPLVGTLGFEFSLVMSIVLAFVSVFISSQFINTDLKHKYSGERRFVDLLFAILIINFLVSLFPFSIGLISSFLKDDCFIKEGIIFYLLIPVATVFFSSSLGALVGKIFPRIGFFLGFLVILGTFCFSIWRLYHNPSFFFYNPIIGIFPGPIYDEVIPITVTLVVYRLIILIWGIFFLLILKLILGLEHRRLSARDIFVTILVGVVLLFSHIKESDLGIYYTRDYITKNFLASSYETDHFIIYYTPGTPEAKNIDLIASDHEWRYNQLKDLLKINSNEKIRSYIYPDTETRKRLMGAGDTTMANPIKKEIHLVYDTFPYPILKHELAHVLGSEFGMDLLYISPKVGLIEGLAVAADWSDKAYTQHEWSKALIESGKSPQIQDIVGIGFWYAPPEISYSMMGSFSRYLIDTHGIEKFKVLYKTGDFLVYKKGLDELVSEWELYLDGVSIPEKVMILSEKRFSEPSIFQGRCPRRVAQLKEKGVKEFDNGNIYSAINFFKMALSFNEHDPILISSLAYSYYYDRKYDKVLGVIDGNENLNKVDKQILENLKGNSHWQSGKVNEAEIIFKKIPRDQIPKEIEREIEIKLSAIMEDGEVDDGMLEFFSTKDEVIQVGALNEIIRKYPDYSPSYYLLGRLYFNRGEYEKAYGYLRESEALGLPSLNLELENLRLSGISLFAIGDYDGAINSFERVIKLDPDGELKYYAQDFIARCKWAKGK
ncbi:MAG: tetratricopeptide repeat protein [Thermodesulfobacteriota bacterium]